MSTIVKHSRDHRGMLTSRCPRCGVQYVYWDPEDLDDAGNLRCYCDADDATGQPLLPYVDTYAAACADASQLDIFDALEETS